MRLIVVLLLVVVTGCSVSKEQDKWANEPNEIKYSKSREKEVWGHVLRGKDPELFYGTPLHKIAESIVDNDNALIKTELENLSPKEINFQEGKYNITLNYFAIMHANYEALKLLTEYGADPNIASIKGETAFTVSISEAQNQNDNRYMTLLIDNGADVNYKNGLETVLMRASSYNLENVKLLVEAGADPHYAYSNDKSTFVHSPLNTSIMHNRIDIVNYCFG